MRKSIVLLALSGLTSLPACKSFFGRDVLSSAPMVTDSTQYTVRFDGTFHRVDVGYEFINSTGETLSSTHCLAPPPPILETRVDGEWRTAYASAVPACLSIPHFRVEPGSVFQATLAIAAGPAGSNWYPQLTAGEIPGIYRLRWRLVIGPDPENKEAPRLEILSNEFRLVGQ